MRHGTVLEHLVVPGALWNALDKAGHFIGDYTIKAGHQDVADKLIDGCQHIRSYVLQYYVVLLVTS